VRGRGRAPGPVRRHVGGGVRRIESKLLGQVRLVLLGRALIAESGSFTLKQAGLPKREGRPLGVERAVADVDGLGERYANLAPLSLTRSSARVPDLFDHTKTSFFITNDPKTPMITGKSPKDGGRGSCPP
jgi:hypothetical protein